MKIVYIDNNEATATIFRQIVTQHSGVECLTISDSKRAVVTLIETREMPDSIVINCAINDITCKSLIQFIRKRSELAQTKMFVLGGHFSAKELKSYATLGIKRCVATTFDVASLRLVAESIVTVSAV